MTSLVVNQYTDDVVMSNCLTVHICSITYFGKNTFAKRNELFQTKYLEKEVASDQFVTNYNVLKLKACLMQFRDISHVSLHFSSPGKQY